MFTQKERGQRKFVPITPAFSHHRSRNMWLTTGAAIILVTIIVAVCLGIWVALN